MAHIPALTTSYLSIFFAFCMVSYDDSGFTGPTMIQLFTRVCPGYWDGTDDNIRLEFRNRYPSEPRETCMTDYLDKTGAEFVSGHEDK